MYLRASNGIYLRWRNFHNIGVNKNGRPHRELSVVGAPPHNNSLDVRVGRRGGSHVRAGDGKIIDVGPRSSHIAGLPMRRSRRRRRSRIEIEFLRPKKDDPDNYVRILLGTKVYRHTNTCAAND
jgi:hypothetical protein